MPKQLPVHPSLRHPRTGRPLIAVGFTASGRVVWPMIGADDADTLTRINELAARIGDADKPLTDAELAELRTMLAAEVQALETAEVTDETLEHISAVADHAEAAAAEHTAREEAAAARQTQRDEALTRARGAVPAPEAPEGEQGDGTVDLTEGGTPAPAEGEQVPVAASARPKPVPLSQVRQTRQPEREAPTDDSDGRVKATLTASAGPRAGMNIGDGDEGMEALAQSFDQAFRDIRASGSSTQSRVIVASGRYSLGGEKLSNKDNPEVTRAKMDRAYKADLERGKTLHAQGLTASGGICAPVTIDYNIPTWQNADMPMLAALPSIDAPRGGLQFMLPAKYSQATYGAGVGIWSNPNDINPGGAGTGALSAPSTPGPLVKPVLTVNCSASTEVDVEAITEIIQLSNFRGRFSPEQTAVAMGYLEEAYAAKREIEYIKQMRNSANHVTVAQAFGATRDILNFFDRVRAYFRSIYRLSDNVPLRAVMNAYVREVIRTDLRKAAFPAEADAGFNSLMVTDAQIDAFFASVNLLPVWVLDDDVADGTHSDQTFAAATAGTAGSPSTFPAFPARNGAGATTVAIRALIYPEGTYQRLDGGQLDLGVVRDSALNAVNEYQIFSESFEAIAFRGFEAVDFVGDFIANGATAGSITPA